MGSSVTGPSPSDPAVSRQRHHWLENIRAASIPFFRKRAPICAACLRPSSDRFLCVAQSPIVNAEGSPVPGAMACRRSAACPFEASARQRAVSSDAETLGATPRRRAKANTTILPDRPATYDGLPTIEIACLCFKPIIPAPALTPPGRRGWRRNPRSRGVFGRVWTTPSRLFRRPAADIECPIPGRALNGQIERPWVAAREQTPAVQAVTPVWDGSSIGGNACPGNPLPMINGLPFPGCSRRPR